MKPSSSSTWFPSGSSIASTTCWAARRTIRTAIPFRPRKGAIPARHLDSLLTCPINTPLVVARIADQDPSFLRFIEKNDLKPGQAIEVETRDTAADSVLLRGNNRRSITIGTRAASKLLVETRNIV